MLALNVSLPKVTCFLSLLVSLLVVGSGCSGNTGAADQGPNAQRIRAVEASISQWKEMEESGDWQRMIDEGVAYDAISERAYLKKPQDYPKFMIQQFEKKLEKLKKEPENQTEPQP
jgi:hypothetical protein